MTATAIPSTTFAAPDDRTATEPPEHRGLARDEVRLLVASPDGIVHTRFRDLPHHLRAGDLLVVNTSATLPAELDGRWRGSQPVVVHLASDLRDGTWVAELRTAPDGAEPVLDASPGEVVRLPGRLRLAWIEPYPRPGSSPTGAGNRLGRVRVTGAPSVNRKLQRHGRPIAYGYLSGRFPLSDYQTIFAADPGSAEMPSADQFGYQVGGERSASAGHFSTARVDGEDGLVVAEGEAAAQVPVSDGAAVPL